MNSENDRLGMTQSTELPLKFSGPSVSMSKDHVFISGDTEKQSC